MPSTVRSLFRGNASTTSTTLYTTPASTTTVVTEIVACNTSASSQSVSIFLNGVDILEAAPVAADTTLVVPLKQPISASQTITGFATATSVRFHIAGVEIT